jgi:hypothetical protein
MTERERHDPLLDQHRELVGHHWPTPLPGPERFQPGALDLTLPAVIGRAMHAHQPARLADPALGGEREQLQAITEQHVILRHAAAPFAWR